jgi:peptidoglycan L-alanyl-D-glutamate endopeptidase CwlK
MDLAATELGYANRIIWGGAWDKTLAQYGGDASKYAEEVANYRRRNPGPDFIDGPHFEWKN